MMAPPSLEGALEEAVSQWQGVRKRPLFGWRGFLVGRRVFGCCHAEGEELLVWTKLPEPLWGEAMATPQARPHPFKFRSWLELRAGNEEELDAALVWLHHAYEWVREGEPLEVATREVP